MIQFNKTIFQFTKRFALVVMLIGVSNAVWAEEIVNGLIDYSSTEYYGKVTAQSSNGKGLIYISQTEVEEGQELTYVASQIINFTNVAWFGNRRPVYFYCYASETEVENSVWAGWYDQDDNLVGDDYGFEAQFPADPTSETQNNPTQYTLTAKWVQPKVIMFPTEIIEFDEIDDNTAPASQTAVFGIADYSLISHFKVTPEEVNNFTVTLPEGAVTKPDNWQGTATVNIAYSPKGVHGTHEGEAFLSSILYTGDFNSNSDFFKRVLFRVVENYKPEFDVVHNTPEDAFTFTLTNVGGTASSEDNLQVIEDSKNYAASAPIYIIGDKRHTTIWTASIEPEPGYEDYAQYFTIQESDPEQPTEVPVVIFNAGFTVAEGESKTVKARLKISCTYQDRNQPNPTPNVKSDDKIIYLTATAIQTNEAMLDIVTDGDVDTYEYPNIIYIGETPSFSFPLTNINVKDIIGQWTAPNDIFDAVITNSTIRFSIKDKISEDQYISCGDFTSTFKITATSTIDNSTQKEDEITIKVTTALATPQITATGADKQVVVRWAPIPGATEYVIYSDDEGENEITRTTECQYIATFESNGQEFSCCVRAINDRCSSNLSLMKEAEANLDEITFSNATTTGIFTGTENGKGDYEENFPWRTKRQVNVSAAFDIKGNALFDRLYIFGITDGTEIDNLETPCYIYNRDSEKKKYTLLKEGNEAKDIVMNKDNNKDESFVIDLSKPNPPTTIYFTGYCPYGSTGGKDDNGVINIKGGSKTIDIYIDSLQLYARTKKNDKIELTKLEDLSGNAYFTQGSGSVFSFESTSTDSQYPFNVRVHIRGNNTLVSQNGSMISIDIDETDNDEESIITINDTPEHYSSPIEILPIIDGSSATLTIDDKWNAENTNGVLVLKENGTKKSNISIGLGNEKTKLTLEGGQLYLQDVASSYCSTIYSFSYDAGEEGTISGSVPLYNVYGTGNTYKGMLNTNTQIALKDGTYNRVDGNNTSIKFYTNDLDIDGGSYNNLPEQYKEGNKEEKLYNKDNKELYSATVSDVTKYGTIENGRAVISKFALMVDDLFPHAGVNYKISEDSYYHYPLSAYYVGDYTYGHNSLAPTDQKVVHLLLPMLKCDSLTFPWQICSPNFESHVDNQLISLGGGREKIDGCQEEEHNSTYTIRNLLYMQIDEITKDALADYSLNQNNVNVEISLADDEPLYQTINNAADYVIENKVYMLMPIEAAKWTLFTAPFNIENVYVIESYPEAQLISDFDGVRNKIPATYIDDARKAQAHRLIDLYTFWYYEGKAIGEAQDFFGEGEDYENGYGSFVNDWINYQLNDNWKEDAEANYTPVIDRLQHYWAKRDAEGKVTEHNLKQSHYYLYKAGTNWTYDGANFTSKWIDITDEVKATDGALMKQGETYIMQFPYNSIGGVHDPSTTWDYWTGKYLLIESTVGPHTINGSSFVTNALADTNVEHGTASLFGNGTFAEVSATLPSKDGVDTTMWALEKKAAGSKGNDTERDVHEMVQQTTATLAPTTGVLLANFQAPSGLRARSINYRTGEVIYESVENPDNNGGDITSGVPTIMGNLTLVVEPTAEGLTITPLKEQHVMLFDAEGKMIFSEYMSEEVSVNLPTGVYVVRGEYEQVKAIKK